MLHLQVESMAAIKEAMRDKEISAKAKAIIGYAIAMGDGFDISNALLIEDMCEGASAIRRAVKSLEDAGYLVRTQDPGTGTFTWDWHLTIPKSKQ